MARWGEGEEHEQIGDIMVKNAPFLEMYRTRMISLASVPQLDCLPPGQVMDLGIVIFNNGAAVRPVHPQPGA